MERCQVVPEESTPAHPGGRSTSRKRQTWQQQAGRSWADCTHLPQTEWRAAAGWRAPLPVCQRPRGAPTSRKQSGAASQAVHDKFSGPHRRSGCTRSTHFPFAPRQKPSCSPFCVPQFLRSTVTQKVTSVRPNCLSRVLRFDHLWPISKKRRQRSRKSYPSRFDSSA